MYILFMFCCSKHHYEELLINITFWIEIYWHSYMFIELKNKLGYKQFSLYIFAIKFINYKMLYLEDYLEMIEHLPQELRDRFTEMREMDLQVQNAMDSLDERVKQFFANAKKLKPEQREVEYEKLRQDYYKALEDADEKVQIANQIYDLVDRYLRRLDQELQKFKMELEADNVGITEILERRSLELDNPSQSSNNVKGEKRKYSYQLGESNRHQPEKRTVNSRESNDKVLSSLAMEAMRETITNSRNSSVGSCNHSSSSSTSSTSSNSSAGSSISERGILLPQPALSYGLGSNAIAAAASQAIAATQQMQQGRRTASLKASYEAINSGLQTISREFTLGSRDIGSLTPTMSGSIPERKTKSKKMTSTSQSQAIELVPPPPCEDSGDSSLVDENGQPLDWSYDPNEPRYCICNQVSYGDMVACDNEDCPVEWFHYACVGITQPPKGKWYCPQCTSAMKRRGRKEK
ncbi:inhibitor of growth protein 3-like isoform X1 [Centruroides sculpturatus]|uniref:inhibitor of growth protein 3-like isoform X1 n=2 Tax=Centruroides sculpturatus TaxID=218467 RepID=UPI000C6D3061|nr:inhibitor of growth protein 3-like isoform X1 [Centruroides sculpturatus]XP_023218917.1 inhibitor of growth protein 3-like isoform X1 [Centruroides sculpturatus]XP_023218924.1 inhibitor of growth protein 3-like isoform X1 [Centruroides sculpturatus]XP_023218931.1 inhibitor of growth protein 3-like isoform X1 [Centruroides sculpturatus]